MKTISRAPILAGSFVAAIVVVWMAVAQDELGPPATSAAAAEAESSQIGADSESTPDSPANAATTDGDATAGQGESLLPDDEGESLLPDDEGESLLPDDEGESLLPDAEGEGLLPHEGESLLPEDAPIPPDDGLFPGAGVGTFDTSLPTEPDPAADDGVAETDAAAAHTTYLKWLEGEKRFPTAVTCAKCHPDHFAEWSVSAHGYAQMSPMFNTMQATVLKLTAGTNGDFCIRCHTQIGMQREEPLFTSNLKRHPASIEGITCVVCHRVDRDYGKVSGRTAIVEGDLLKEVYGPKGNAILKAAIEDKDKFKIQDKDIDGPRPVHADVVKFDPITTSGFCGTCHDVNLLNGFRLEEAFSQFKNSPANKRGETCQDCHMGVTPGVAKPKQERFASARKGGVNEMLGLVQLRKTEERDMNYQWAPAARVGDERTPTPDRKRTNHMFAGPDYSIIHPGLFPHSPDLKDFTYQSRISRGLREAEAKAEDQSQEFDYGKAELKSIEQAKIYSLSDWLSFRWEDGWGTEEFEEREKERANADRKAVGEGGGGKRRSVFANLPEKERETVVAAGWHDPDPKKWRKGARARKEARRLLDAQFELLNRINVERFQVWRRGLQLGDFVVMQNDRRGLRFKVDVVNGTDGHGVPTGFDAERVVFLQVDVADRNGRTVFTSGDRDPNGDVRDLHSSYVHAGKLPIDRQLFNLQSKFLTRNIRGGEEEAIVPINHSPDPLPYVRPDTRSGILVGRPVGARKQAKLLPPLGHRWAEYRVTGEQLTGDGPYRVNLKVIAQMVPVNLIKTVGGVGFDYNLSPLEVAKRVVWGHRVSPSKEDSNRRGGALTLWDRTLVLDGKWKTRSLKPTEQDIMANPPAPFPVQPREPEEEASPDILAPPLPGGVEELLPGELEDLLHNAGESLLPNDGLLPGADGESLLPDEEGESLLPDEEGESLLPDEEGESLLPEQVS